MIEPMKGPRNHELALATCDECDATHSVLAAHTHHNGFARGGAPVLKLAKEAQAITKLTKAGWSVVKGKHLCPECTAKRAPEKNEQEIEAVTTKTDTKTAIRKPTLDQRRQIVEMLVIAYDGAMQRYKGHDTDKTIADAIGSGVMSGWVAEIREENFGPAGGNEEIDAIREKIGEVAIMIGKEMERNKCELEAFRQEHNDLRKRLDMVRAAVGPRARA